MGRVRTVEEKQRRSRLLLPLFCIFYFKCEERSTSFLSREKKSKIDETVKNVTKPKKRTNKMTHDKGKGHIIKKG
jgi:hypothetical protein